METTDILFRYGFPIVGALLSFYYAFRALVGKDASVIMGNNYKVKNDEEGYVRKAGYLFIYFGVLLIVYSFIMSFSVVAGLVVLIVGLIILFVIFGQLNKKHGAESLTKK